MSAVGLSGDVEDVARRLGGESIVRGQLYEGVEPGLESMVLSARGHLVDRKSTCFVFLLGIENGESRVIEVSSNGGVRDYSRGGGSAIGRDEVLVRKELVKCLYFEDDEKGARGTCFDMVCGHEGGGENLLEEEWRGVGFTMRLIMNSLRKANIAKGDDEGDKERSVDKTSNADDGLNCLDVLVMNQDGVYRLGREAVEEAVGDVRRFIPQDRLKK